MTTSTETRAFVPCRFGTRTATCYHVPRCFHQVPGNWSSPFGHYAQDAEPVTDTWLADPADMTAINDARADFAAQCERTVAPGFCTGCEQPAPELLPWTPSERLCLHCVDVQLDLLAKAIREGDGHAVNVMKARWV